MSSTWHEQQSFSMKLCIAPKSRVTGTYMFITFSVLGCLLSLGTLRYGYVYTELLLSLLCPACN